MIRMEELIPREIEQHSWYSAHGRARVLVMPVDNTGELLHYLWTIDVVAEWRGQGEGERLLRAVLDWCDRHKYRLMVLAMADMATQMPALLAWYGRHGFVESGQGIKWGREMIREPREVDHARGTDPGISYLRGIDQQASGYEQDWQRSRRRR